jgi:hypothetical protein
VHQPRAARGRSWGVRSAGALLGLALAQPASAQDATAATAQSSPPAAPTLTPPPVEPLLPSTAAPTADVPRNQDPRAGDAERPADKPWRVSAQAQYRSLLVSDEDPANDRFMLYRAGAAYYPLAWLSVFGRVGLNQRFVSVQGESGVRMEDLVLGAAAEQRVSLAPLGWQRELGLSHSFRVYLPTSFTSQQQDLYLAVDWSTRARVQLVSTLFAGVRGSLHYRFHEYAEQAGPGGGTLPRFVVGLAPFIEYSPLVSDKWGTITVGADLMGDETIDYPSRDPADIAASQLPPGTLASDGSIGRSGGSDSFVTPHYGYDVYAAYKPPIPYLSFSVSLEQSGNVVRYGEPRLYFIHRDQTELVLQAAASF